MTRLRQSIQTGVGGGTGVQNLGYEWDLVGNLKKRKDLNQSNLTEEFFYDRLYRLDYSTLNGVQNLDLNYDLLGNLIGRSNVGTYTYHATKKHQVVSTSNGWSFGYDANGNMTSGRGAAMEWTSYNYPACIRTAGACTGTTSDWSQFSYTPDRQYWKQVSNYLAGGSATTIYVDGLLEKVTTSGGTDYRHMIRAGNATIIVSRTAGGVNSVKYVTSDHLGSSAAVTISSGGILVNESFDAIGKRRGANWTGSPSGGDWTAIAATTRRGFTAHSMLDNLNLTHMNGRVYDQALGRFISADPHITEPLNTQNFNRYSYVYNNPLSATDPSGFDETACQASHGSAGCTPDEVIVTGTRQPACEAACMAARAAALEGESYSNQANAEASQVTAPMEEIVVCAGCNYGRGGIREGERVGDFQCASSVGCFRNLNGQWYNSEPGLEAVWWETWLIGFGARAELAIEAGVGRSGVYAADLSKVYVVAPKSGVTVYRVFGGDSRAMGYSWTTVDPRTVKSVRDGLSLPSGGATGSVNTADFMVAGRANVTDIIQSRGAIALDGNKGGLPELVIDPRNVTIFDFSVLKP